MSQTVETQFGTGTVVDREAVRGRVSYKVEGPNFSTWVEATAMPVDFEWMPHPDDIQDNSVTLPYNPSPQTWVNPSDQNIVPGRQGIDPDKRTSPADSVDLQEDGESYEPGPDPKLFATGGLSPQDIQAKLGPKYVNAFVEHDFTSLQARLEEHPEIVMAEARERVAELVAQADQDHLERVGRNEYLEASDPQIREAAWADVRAKAVRLRKSGQVNTRGATPDIILSQVTGDHGTYEVVVRRSNIFQGSSAVDEWSCECPWGQWAFKREHTFVGRLCSHAYATLMELQALSRMKNPSPVFRNQPAVFASRTAADDNRDLLVEIAEDAAYQYELDTGNDPTISPDFLTQYLNRWVGANPYAQNVDYDELKEVASEEGFGGYTYASRQAEMVDIRPVGWDPYARNLMNRLRDLWDEGSRPGRQKERNEEVRELVEELRDRGYATDGIIASFREAFIDRPLGYGDIPDYGFSEDYILEHELENREDVTEPEFEYPAGGGHGVVQDINDGMRSARRIASSQWNFNKDTAALVLNGDIFGDEQYSVVIGTGSDWSNSNHLEEGVWSVRERDGNVRSEIGSGRASSVEEAWQQASQVAPGIPPIDTDYRRLTVDIFGSRTSALSLPKGTQVQRLNLDGSPSGQTGVVSRDHQGLTEWDQVAVLWDGDDKPSLNDLTEVQWGEYEDGTPTKELNDPWNIHGGRNLTAGSADHNTFIDALEQNGWVVTEHNDATDFHPVFSISGRMGDQYIVKCLFSKRTTQGRFIEGSISTQGHTGFPKDLIAHTTDMDEALGWLNRYKTSAYEDDYSYGEPPAYDSGDEFGGDEDPFYVDPMEREDWPEDDIVANFQRNAGHLLGDSGGDSGGHDDISAAAAAHLRTAGRNFTMAEQQALIDEDDGNPYDRSQLRLDGTHYL